MRNLKTLPCPINIEEREELYNSITIFEKIEFSNISKQQIRDKIRDLRERQVPNREVLIDHDDEEVVDYWFRNWLHPSLRHYFPKSPRDKRGCSQEALKRDLRGDFLRFYENGQHNYTYTLAEIERYAMEPSWDDVERIKDIPADCDGCRYDSVCTDPLGTGDSPAEHECLCRSVTNCPMIDEVIDRMACEFRGD